MQRKLLKQGRDVHRRVVPYAKYQYDGQGNESCKREHHREERKTQGVVANASVPKPHQQQVRSCTPIQGDDTEKPCVPS